MFGNKTIGVPADQSNTASSVAPVVTGAAVTFTQGALVSSLRAAGHNKAAAAVNIVSTLGALVGAAAPNAYVQESSRGILYGQAARLGDAAGEVAGPFLSKAKTSASNEDYARVAKTQANVQASTQANTQTKTQEQTVTVAATAPAASA
jgi:hypothetical protein